MVKGVTRSNRSSASYQSVRPARTTGTRSLATERARTRSSAGPDFASFHQLYEERRDQLWQFLLILAPRPGDVPPLYVRTWFEYVAKLCRHRRRPGEGFPAELYRTACENVLGAWRAAPPERRAAGHVVVRDAGGPDWVQKLQQAMLATLVEHNGLEAWQAARLVALELARAEAMLEAASREMPGGQGLAARVRGQSLHHAGSAPHKSMDTRVLGQARQLIDAPPSPRGRDVRHGFLAAGRSLLRRVAILVLVVGITGVAVTWAAMSLADRPKPLAIHDAPADPAAAGLSVEELFAAVERADRSGDYNRVARLSAALDLRLAHPAQI